MSKKEEIIAEIDKLRQRIDDIDIMLVKLLSERTYMRRRYWQVKIAAGS